MPSFRRPRLVEVWEDRVEPRWIAAAKVGRQLWREAVEVNDPDRPPFWPYAFGLLAAVFMFLVFALMVAIILASVVWPVIRGFASQVEATARFSDWRSAIEAPLREYIQQHSTGLPVSSAALFSAWIVVGGILLVASYRGSLGARIGWMVFGGFSCVAAYAGTHPPAQGMAAGIAAFAWSLISILAFRHAGWRRTRGRAQWGTRRESEADRLEELKNRASRSARIQGFKDLDEYFGEHGNQRIDTIASELRIPKARVGQLREKYLEPSISLRSSLPPRQQREIRADVRSGKYSNFEIRKRNDCSQKDIRQIRAKLDASTTEKVAVPDGTSAPPSSPQLPGSGE